MGGWGVLLMDRKRDDGWKLPDIHEYAVCFFILGGTAASAGFVFWSHFIPHDSFASVLSTKFLFILKIFFFFLVD